MSTFNYYAAQVFRYFSGYESYQYKPLATGGDYIRLIELQPALRAEAPIHITFQHDYRLDHHKYRYEAISYHWGEPKFVHTLYVERRFQLMVTENLYQALKQVRQPTTPRRLWVDAICINQADDAEKSRQIPLMASIFHRASAVLACVGGGEVEERGLQNLDKWSRNTAAAAGLVVRRSKPNQEISGTKSQVNTLNVYLEVSSFLGLPWFSRLWIIQEIVTNSDVLILCGRSELSWVRLITAINALRDEILNEYATLPPLGKVSLLARGALHSLPAIAKLWQANCRMHVNDTLMSPRTEGAGILDLLQVFCHFECTDPRDRIFSLYNVADDLRPAHLESRTVLGPLFRKEGLIYMDIDYSKNIQSTYQKFAEACLQNGQGTELLNAKLLRQYVIRSQSWPSWVPDWRIKPSPYVRTMSDGVIGIDIQANPISNTNVLTLLLNVEYNFKGDHFPVIDDKFSIGRTALDLIRSMTILCQNCPPETIASFFATILHVEGADDFLLAAQWVSDNISSPSKLNSTAPPDVIIAIFERYQQLLANNCLFSATHNGSYFSNKNVVRYVGFGNEQLEPGDELRPLGNSIKTFLHFDGYHSLILRPVQHSHVPMQVHRLIGSAFLSSPMYNRPQMHPTDNKPWQTAIYLE